MKEPGWEFSQDTGEPPMMSVMGYLITIVSQDFGLIQRLVSPTEHCPHHCPGKFIWQMQGS